MGEPIDIEALAEAMIGMKAMVPGLDISIQTTDLWPGEKLHEALAYPHERLDETGVDGLQIVTPQAGLKEPDGFWDLLSQLLDQARQRDRKQALERLSKLVPAYRSQQD